MTRGNGYIALVITVFGQRKTAPVTIAWMVTGASIENHTTRNKRRYDLLVTSLPQQRGCRGSSRRGRCSVRTRLTVLTQRWQQPVSRPARSTDLHRQS